MRILFIRNAGRRSARFRLAPASAALAVLAGLSAAPSRAMGAPARLQRFRLQLSLPQGRDRFHRGGADPASPVQGLVPTVTLTNTSADLPVSLPLPALTVHGGIDFEVHLLGAPTGIPKTPETPERTRIPRSPLAQPLGLPLDVPGVTLKPGESKRFRVNVGNWCAIRKAGRYEMSCALEEERSNTVTFEVLPLKAINMRVKQLLSRIEDFERQGPDFPFMFYVAHGDGRFNEVVYLVRRGRGGDEHYEYHRLSEIAPGQVPDMITSPEKPGLVGVLVPDKREERLSRLFVIDFGRAPIRVAGREIVHAAGERPGLVLDASGGVTVQ